MRKIARLGWIRDPLDPRDKKFSVAEPIPLPPSVTLSNDQQTVFDQGQLGSCTANAIAGAIDFARQKQAPVVEQDPSRLFIYYNERVAEGSVNSDCGAVIRDGIKSVASIGVPPESMWPYDPSKFAVQPPPECYAAALRTKVLSYASVPQDLTSLKTCLALGFPFVFGFVVYEEFESETVAQTGIVPTPSPSDTPIGGHAVLCVGYHDSTSRFRARNSWGPSWGQGGFFEIGYDYLTNPQLASDFWQIDETQLG